MKKSILVLSVALLSANLVVANSMGTRPLSNVRKYPVSVEKDGVSVGARLLSEKEVLQTFVTPMKGKYVVVEVAMYPGVNDIEVDNRDFVLRIDGFEPVVPSPGAEPDRHRPAANDQAGQKSRHRSLRQHRIRTGTRPLSRSPAFPQTQ